jgi:hypothetical protein
MAILSRPKTRTPPLVRSNAYKSEGERRIAGFLEAVAIPFEYEKPLAVVDAGKTKIWYPDFTLVDYGSILVEYFGVGGSEDYERRAQQKLKVYEANCLDVIPVYPQDFKGDWKGNLMVGIYATLERRIQDFFEVFKGKKVEKVRGG